MQNYIPSFKGYYRGHMNVEFCGTSEIMEVGANYQGKLSPALTSDV